MNGNSPSYHEKLLHWIWETRHFEQHNLHTNDGKQVAIHHTGSLNESDGPDFKGAKISIGNLRWHGDVEIHWKLSDWRAHSHQTDTNFNQVVLHVIFEENDQTVLRSDQTRIPTLSLSSHLDKPLQAFLEQYLRGPRLPCSGQLSFISEEAFRRQIQKAHKEYFEQKVDDLLEFYVPDLVPSEAWLKMLTVALFDGLGISHNRASMRKLGAQLFAKADEVSTAAELRREALRVSGINNKTRESSPLKWNYKGVRPGNHPRPRIQQGADCLWHLKSRPFSEWMRGDPERLWDELVASVSVTPSLGAERGGILFGTVFLPALYSLGNLFFCEELKSKSWELWKNHRVSLPQSLLRLLEQTDLPSSLYAQKLGTIYQLRSYCKPKNCRDCKVFQTAISS